MSDRENHCPFLNRADHRCSGYFSIERLQHAFEHCFHAYKACGIYRELLVERQSRRSQAAAASGGAGRIVWATACSTPERDVTTSTQFVQVRLPSVVPAAAAATSAAA